jgi:hypothetical protein
MGATLALIPTVTLTGRDQPAKVQWTMPAGSRGHSSRLVCSLEGEDWARPVAWSVAQNDRTKDDELLYFGRFATAQAQTRRALIDRTCAPPRRVCKRTYSWLIGVVRCGNDRAAPQSRHHRAAPPGAGWHPSCSLLPRVGRRSRLRPWSSQRDHQHGRATAAVWVLAGHR